MDPMKTCELLLGPLLTIILTAIIVPYLSAFIGCTVKRA